MKRYALAKSSFIALFFLGGVCPLCIPKLVVIASLFGITLAPQNSPFMQILFHCMFLVVCLFSYKNYKKHNIAVPFILTMVGCLYLVLYSHLFPHVFILPFWTLYTTLGILVGAALLDYYLCIKYKVPCTVCCVSSSSNASEPESQSSCCS